MKNKIIPPGDHRLDNNKNLKWNILFAILSGALLILSFPKYGSGFVAWFAFIPLLFALYRVTSIRQAILLGFITGVVSYTGIVYWIVYVVVNYGYLPVYLGIAIMLLLACYLSVYLAIFAAGIVYFRRKIPLYLIAPVLWICLEYCKSQLFTGFPWENLGYSQYLNLYLIQFADILGVFGLSFLIILVNVSLFEIITKRSKRKYIIAAAVSLVLVTVYIYGIFRVNNIDNLLQNPSAPSMEVSLIQGNIDQSIKWNENFQKETLNIYEDISLKNIPVSGGLIVWPETAVPFNFQDENDLSRQIRNLSIKTKSDFIFGSMSYSRRSHYKDFYNSAYLLSPEGEVKGKYDKVHLVPYGEYVPLRNVFPFIKGLTAGIGDFSTGDGYFPLSAADRKIGVLICYEGILPFAARMYKKESAEILVNITNDAWFGSTSAPYQHLSMTIFRAVETRLYLVRAANTGISAIVDPRGHIVAQTNIFQKDSLKGKIKFLKIPTFYAEHGDILVVVCFTLSILCLLWSWKGRLRNAGRKHSRKN
jgi:apolipoprotein N-acyltransferase